MPLDIDGHWYPDLFEKQLDVFNCTKRVTLVCGCRKSGKCVDADTIVCVNGRLTRIGKLGALKDGEQHVFEGVVESLIDSHIAPSATSHIYRDPAKVGIRITTRRGYAITGSEWHPVWSWCDGTFAYRTTTEIEALLSAGRVPWVPIVRGATWADGAPLVVRYKSVHKWQKHRFAIQEQIKEAVRSGAQNWHRIAKLASTSYRPIKRFFSELPVTLDREVLLDSDLGYVVGALIGDGGMTDKMLLRNRISFASNDAEITDSLRRTLSSKFHGTTMRHIAGCDWGICGTELISFVLHLGMNKYSHEKTVPDEILRSPKSVVRAFLQGLFDTDGSSSKHGYIEYCSSSRSLAEDVHRLLLLFGIRSRIKFRPNHCKGAWHIYIDGEARKFYETIGFRLKRKQDRASALRDGRRESMDYPDAIRPHIKKIYLSRHSRGAIHGNLPRTNKHGGFGHFYSIGGCGVQSRKLALFMAFSHAEDDPLLNSFYLDGRVWWEPIRSAERCAADLYDFTVPVNQNFVGNGFINHNTRAILHKIVRHMWEVDGAQVAMFSRTMKNSKDGGPWRILHKETIPQWVKARIGLKYTTYTMEKRPGFKVDNQTRTPYFRIRNSHGGESECMLFSLDNDNEVEDKLKEMEFSMIYFSELDKFGDRRVLSVGLLSLRGGGIPFDKMQWIADCNPSEDGESSWIYKVFYRERVQDYQEYVAESTLLGLNVLPEPLFLSNQSELDLIEITLDDNTRLDPRECEEIKATYVYDPGLYARYVLGKWVYGEGDQSRHFRGLYNPAFHAVGDCSSVDRSQWLLPVPSENCFELLLGFDMGDVNHAACIFEIKILGGRLSFVMLDELVSLGQEVSNEEFIRDGFMPQIEALDALSGRTLRLDKCWADSSMLEKFSSAGGGTYQADEVEIASVGRIRLMGIRKGWGSVRARVQLVKKLLHQRRLVISAHCTHTLEMFKNLKKGDSDLDYVLRSDKNKHIFDAMSYALLGECGEEDLRSTTVGRRRLAPITSQVG